MAIKTMEKGSPSTIHFKNDISILYSLSNKPIKTELGGVPITVAMPPAFAENAMPNITQRAKFWSLFVNPSASLINKPMTDMAIGSITTVLAVLLIHMLNVAVAIINPKTTLFGVVPVILIIFRAIRLCKFTFSRAKAMTKPPKKRNKIGLPKLAPTSVMGIILSIGKRSRGKSAVTEIETASVILQIIIQSATAITASPWMESISKGRLMTIKNRIGPKNSPNLLLNCIVFNWLA